MEYRILHHVDELEIATDVEIAAWGLDPRFAVPSNLMHATTHSNGGGVVIGAYDGERMIGMSFGLPVRRENQWILWSHMTGVTPSYQGRGVGFGLKQAQRKWALDYGYNAIGWTFDPLQRGNAKFNLYYLGAIACIYHVNLYGEMTDSINAGMESDRLEATWILRDERVAKLASGEQPAALLSTYSDDMLLVRADSHGHPLVNTAGLDGSEWRLVEIPGSLRELKTASLSLAQDWQRAVRSVLEAAFQQGYVAVDFMSDSTRYAYVLRRVQQPTRS